MLRKKLSLDISFWAQIAVTNITMRILYIFNTSSSNYRSRLEFYSLSIKLYFGLKKPY